MTLLVLRLDSHRYALHLSVVERIVRAVMITPLPKAPAIVQGAVNMQGRIIPVVDVRGRFGLPARDIALSDSLVLARTRERLVAFAADVVEGLLERSEHEIVPASSIAPDVGGLDGVAKTEDGIVLIQDLSSFLSLDEERELAAAVPATQPAGMQ